MRLRKTDEMHHTESEDQVSKRQSYYTNYITVTLLFSTTFFNIINSAKQCLFFQKKSYRRTVLSEYGVLSVRHGGFHENQNEEAQYQTIFPAMNIRNVLVN